MIKDARKSKMTLDKLAATTQREFLTMDKKIDSLRDDVGDIKINMATKDDLKHFTTKDDLKHFTTKDDLRGTEVRVLQAVDKVVTKFDAAEKEHAAHTLLHKHITDNLHGHDQRIKKLEMRV